MMTPHRSRFAAASAVAVILVLGAPACKEKEQPSGLVADAATTSAPVDAGGPVDITQCAACQLTPQPAWTFEGIYRDSACTEPLAQMVTPACTVVAPLGSISLSYVDEAGSRKAGEMATVTLTEQVAPEAVRYRKTAKGCVRANESATDITPINCAGQRVCRDQAGALTCANCRTLSNGCPDFQETRVYAVINDPAAGAKPAAGGGGAGGNMARLKQCCNALATEAKRQGNAPELTSAAAQCNSLVQAAGPTGNAPELGALRTLLAGRTLPAVCAGF